MWLKYVSARHLGRAASIALAWFAFAWAVARACVQAVTGDEAQDYLFYAYPNDPSRPWTPAANNHMLNSLGERLFTGVFGLSALTVRIPTLLGAALYIYVMYRICQALSDEWKIRIPVFVCLVYNPFIFDFFVAARGYGIANAFLVSAIAASASWHLWRDKIPSGSARELVAATAISSACLGMAFTANFSLALVGATTMLLLLAWAVRARVVAVWKLIVAGLAPGLTVVLLISSYTILNFPQREVVAGTKSLKVMLMSLLDASRYRPNPSIVNPFLWRFFDFLYNYLLPAVLVLAVVRLLFILYDRVWSRGDAHAVWLTRLGAVAFAAAILAVAEHRLAYRLTRLEMPVSRTALFLLPLVTLAIGLAAAIPALSRGSQWSRNALIASLCLVNLFDLGCMRLTYFQEWDYQQDLKEAYKVLACYNHEKNIQDIESTWEYHGGLLFARVMSGRETFPPFTSTTPLNPGHQMYVLERNFDHSFVVQQGLKVVYEGPNSGLDIAVLPELADDKGGACYVWQ